MEPLRLALFITGLISFAYLLVHQHPGMKVTPSESQMECIHTVANDSLQGFRDNPQTYFRLEDDVKLIGEEGLVCTPESFGYTPEEADLLFHNKTFPSCKERTGFKSHIIRLSPDYSSFTLTCAHGGVYVLGVRSSLEEMGKNSFTNSVQQYGGHPVPLTTEEYILASCDDKQNNFDDILYINRPSAEAMERAAANLRNAPLHVVMLVLDSVSRRSLFRKLPQTLGLLNDLPLEFESFDFKLHNVMGEHSNESFMPTFFGEMEYERLSGRVYGDPFYEKSLWKKLAAKMTAAMTLLRSLDVIRLLITSKAPFGALRSASTTSSSAYLRNNAQDQRCLGPQNAHWYMYDYALQLQENYASVSTFSYLHPNTAHEASGTVVSTLDADTVDFLRKAMKRHKDNLVVFLMGDHGMRYGAWFTQINGSHEHRLPALFLLASKAVLDRIPDSRRALDSNTKRLVSKYDLHTSLLHLAQIGMDLEEYRKIVCETSAKYRTVSLFMETISKTRSCADVNIPAFWCSCIQFQPQKQSAAHSGMVAEALVHINAQIHTPAGAGFGICRQLSLANIVSISAHQEALQRYYKVEFTVNESLKARFEMVLLVSQKRLKTRQRDGFGSSSFFFGLPSWLKVMYVARLDAYRGICKNLALEFDLDPVTCVCESMETVDVSYPATVTKMLSDYVPVVAATNSSCVDACAAVEMECDDLAQVLLNECFVLYRYGACERCLEQEKAHLITTAKERTCVTAKGEQTKCAEVGRSARYCPCRVRMQIRS